MLFLEVHTAEQQKAVKKCHPICEEMKLFQSLIYNPYGLLIICLMYQFIFVRTSRHNPAAKIACL